MNNPTSNIFLQVAMITGLLMIIYFLCMPVVAGLYNNAKNKEKQKQVQSVFGLSNSQTAAQNLVINRAKTLLSRNPNATIEVVVWLDGINLLTNNSAHKQAILSLMQQGAVFTACQNSLNRLTSELPNTVLLPGVRLIQDGYSYAEQLKNNGFIDELA